MENISDKDLLQASATIIAGTLILMTITTIVSEPNSQLVITNGTSVENDIESPTEKEPFPYFIMLSLWAQIATLMFLILIPLPAYKLLSNIFKISARGLFIVGLFLLFLGLTEFIFPS